MRPITQRVRQDGSLQSQFKASWGDTIAMRMMRTDDGSHYK